MPIKAAAQSPHRCRLGSPTTLAAAASLTVAVGLVASGAPADAMHPAPAPSTLVVNVHGRGVAATRAVARVVGSAGGQVLVQWPAIGVVVATGTAETVSRLRRSSLVDSAGLTGLLRVQPAPSPPLTAPLPARSDDPGNLARQARGPQAHAIADGTGVTVGIVDTGVFDEHSEFTGRFDARRSGSCTDGGRLRIGDRSWRPVGHGAYLTHGTGVASVVAAAADGRGIEGLAPKARIAAMRIADSADNIFPEYVICAAMWSVREGIAVTNHSYGADAAYEIRDGEHWDLDQPDQGAAVEAMNRAFRFARARGVLTIAALGNSGQDLDRLASIANDPPYTDRMRIIPAQADGVLGVAAMIDARTIDFYSNHGLRATAIAAVGNGVVATTPGHYEQNAGTSLAAPVIAGVAALIAQLRPDAGPAQLTSSLTATANQLPCGVASDVIDDQSCLVSGPRTSFFGAGEVDALRAVRVASR